MTILCSYAKPNDWMMMNDDPVYMRHERIFTFLRSQMVKIQNYVDEM